MRPLAISAELIDTGPLRADWSWLVPSQDTPLLVGAFGDCIFGAPDGGHWALSLLEGDYRRVASDSAEFNRLKADRAFAQDWFNLEWVEIACGNGLIPEESECLGWTLHPVLGGKFSSANIQIFSVHVYQSLIGQLFRQLGQAQ